MSGSAAASDWVCERCTWRNGVSDLTCGMCYGVRASSRDVPVVWQWLAGEEWIPYDQHSIQQIEDAYQRGASGVVLQFGYFAVNGGYSISFRPPRSSPSSSSSPAVPSAAPALPHHHQTNHSSGVRRRVRRLAMDEHSLFVDVSDTQRRIDGRCSICQAHLDPAQEEEEEREGTERNERTPVEGEDPHAEQRTEGERGDEVAQSAAPTEASESTAAVAPSRCVRLARCAPGHSFHLECITSWIKLRDSCPTCHTALTM